MATESVGLLDILCRLGAAGLSGGAIGLNRNLHHQGAGLRTYGLVALSTAGLTVGILLAGGGSETLSRVVQGIMAGIAVLCGLGLWLLTAVLLALALGLLVFGRSIERIAERIFGAGPDDDEAHDGL